MAWCSMDINTFTMPAEPIVIPFVEGTIPSREAILERTCKWKSRVGRALQPAYLTNEVYEASKMKAYTNLVIMSTSSDRNHHYISKGRLCPCPTLNSFITMHPCSIDLWEKPSKWRLHCHGWWPTKTQHEKQVKDLKFWQLKYVFCGRLHCIKLCKLNAGSYSPL